MTYSIVARDPETGELGVAVQSHYFSVGSVVPWAEPDAGAVATQAFVDPTYGPLGLELMRAGRQAPEALAGVVASDEQRDMRQVAMVDAGGGADAHTGARCIEAAGHRVGEGYSVQANMMFRDTVWDAMADAYESSTGDLAGRMLDALDAAEAQGGDIRGRQSAALLIVGAESSGRPWADRLYDIRVEDAADPLGELRRLVRLRREYRRAGVAFDLLREGDSEAALSEFAALRPHAAGDELDFWYATRLAVSGRTNEARRRLAAVLEREPRYADLLRRLPAAGLFPEDGELIEQLLSE